MAISAPNYLVGTSIGSPSAGTGVTTSAIDTTSATLIVIVTSNDQAKTGASVSDSKSNSWTGLTIQSSSGQAQTRLFYCIGPTVGSGHTFTITTSASDHSGIGVMAFVTTKTAVFDAQNGSSSTSATTLSSGAVTTAEACELVVIGLCTSGQQSTGFMGPIKPSSPLAISQNVDLINGNHYTQLMGYGLINAAGSINSTWTWAGGATACQAVIAAFKVTASSSAGTAGGAWAFA